MPATKLNIGSSVPLYLKLAQIIMGLLAFFYIVHIGRSIIMPLVLAGILSILVNPLVNYLTHKGLNRIIAIFIVIITSISLCTMLLYFIGHQTMRFTDSLPQFQERFADTFQKGIERVSGTLSIPEQKVRDWVTEMRKASMQQNGAQMISNTLAVAAGLFAFLFLLPVYMFMILFYKPLLLEFIARLFPKEKHITVAEVLLETKTIIQSYLYGLLIETLIVAGLNMAALSIIGVEYALLLAVIGAIFNLIPYVGGLVSFSLPMIMAFATQSPMHALWIFIAYMVIQFFDNNFIVPKIVGSKVRINALASIIAVLVGGAIWGIPGMFLSIPITAIVKVIFDHVEALHAFGFLLGDNQPDIGKEIFNFRRISLRRKKSMVEKVADGEVKGAAQKS